MTEGTKYHPLFEHLLFSGQGRVEMSFAEVEKVIGAKLAPSARRRKEWWSNNAKGHSQARSWLRANYRTSQVDLAGEKIVFQLEGWPNGYRAPDLTKRPGAARTGWGEADQADYVATSDAAGGADHPLFGIWRGKVTLVPGYDYTKPAFEPD